MPKLIYVLALFVLATSCDLPEGPIGGDADVAVDGPDATADIGPDAGDAGGDDPVFEEEQVVFDYGDWTVPAGTEQYPCAQWTLNNEKPLYVNTVTQANDGGFHHSNWYAVPADKYEGPDGFFNCSDRGFQESGGAVFGEVVFAQSTQAYVEDQAFPENVVIKIPPHSKIIGGLHLLNVSSTDLDTGVRMGLQLVHPRDVETIATPWRMDISALRIPANTDRRFRVDCDLSRQYELKADEPLEAVMYWLLPHYHALGNYFRVDLIRPDGDETILELAGFNAEANGVTFPEPIDLTGVTGMRMVCGYYNPTDRLVTYGLEGDDEMCTLLAFTNAKLRLNTQGWDIESSDDSEGPGTQVADCSPLFIPKNAGQEMPSEEEQQAELYVPESNTDGGDAVLVPDCRDTPDDAEPAGGTTLGAVRDDVLMASCAYSSCHDADSPAANLDFTADDLHAELMGHEVQADVDMPLVAPGDSSNSWLYQIISNCAPESNAGVVSAMPRNSPTLLEPSRVAQLRAWIENGALPE